MKPDKSKIILTLFAAILLIVAVLFLAQSCSPAPVKKQEKVLKIHVYKTPDTSYTSNDDTTYVYWYVIMYNYGGPNNYYYYSSPTQIDDFSKTKFIRVDIMPKPVEFSIEDDDIEIPVKSIDTLIQKEIKENPDGFEIEDMYPTDEDGNVGGKIIKNIK